MPVNRIRRMHPDRIDRGATMARKAMSATHKRAMAEGRTQAQVVKAYLDALEQNRPRRGRKRTPDSVKRRLAAIETELAEASSLKRLQLVQERRDLEAELEQMSGERVDLPKLEAQFVKVARAYGESK